MRPLFTIHAGEYLVGAEIEKLFGKQVSVWLPSIDSGVDLLLTDKATRKNSVALQVKFSKDYSSTTVPEKWRPNIRSTGWWGLNRKKIQESEADFWVFPLYGFEKHQSDFIIIKPSQLLALFKKLGRKAETLHMYITVTETGYAIEARGINKKQRIEIAQRTYKVPHERNLTSFLNNWKPIIQQLKVK